jgi:glycosyltransferase involved in cell wall biosynthesis
MKLLAVSYYRPPQLTPQAIQIGRLLRHLQAEVTLLSGQDPSLPARFLQYPAFEREMARVIDAPTPQLLKGRLFNAAHRFLPLFGEAPDTLRGWRREAVRAAGRHLREHDADVLASFGEPMSSHLVALRLKRSTGLPWVAHFSDPWADNPFRQRWPLARRVNALLERVVMTAADRVVFTSARTRETVMRKYPAAWGAKATHLPHSYDLTGVTRGEPPAQGPLVLRHLGAMYGQRGPGPVLQALQRLQAEVPDLGSRLRVEFIGPVSKPLRHLPELQGLAEGMVQFRDPVDYTSSLDLMQTAHALLSIDAPAAVSDFLPSKLIDYLGARRPVLAVSPPGTTHDLVTRLGGLVADPSDPVAIARALRTLLDDPAGVAQRFAAGDARTLIDSFLPGPVAAAFLHVCEDAMRQAPAGDAAVRTGA